MSQRSEAGGQKAEVKNQDEKKWKLEIWPELASARLDEAAKRAKPGSEFTPRAKKLVHGMIFFQFPI